MRLVQQAQQSKSRTQVLADRACRLVVLHLSWGGSHHGGCLDYRHRLQPWRSGTGGHGACYACPHALGWRYRWWCDHHGDGGCKRHPGGVTGWRWKRCAWWTPSCSTRGYADRGPVLAWRASRSMAAWARKKPWRGCGGEGDSEAHHCARHIRERAVKRNLKLPIERFEALEGRGVVAAHSDGKMVYVGGPRLLEMRKLELPEKLANSRQKPA